MKTFLTALLFLVLAAVGWAQPPLQRGFFTTNVTAGGVPYNTIVVHGVTANPRVYIGSSGLTNAFYQLANGDTMLIGPGNYTNKTFYYNFTMPIYCPLLVNAKTNITIIGDGASFISTNYGTMMNIHCSSNVTVKGIRFFGDRIDIMNYTNVGVGWAIQAALFTTGTNYNITIDDCKFIDIPDQAIAPIYGYADGFIVKNCYGYNIGWTNVPGMGLGWGYADGSFIAGLWTHAQFLNNRIEKVKNAVFEWDGGVLAAGSAFVGNDVLIKGNTILDTFNNVLYIVPITTNKCLSEVRYIGNYHQRPYSRTWPDEMTAWVHSDIDIRGASNVVIQGNQFIYGNSICYPVYIRNEHSSIENILITENTFRNAASGSPAILLDKVEKVNTVGRNVHIKNNVFDSSTTAFVDCSMPFVTIEGNKIDTWAAGTGAIWLRGNGPGGGGSASNVVIKNNLFGSYGIPGVSSWVLSMYGGASNKNLIFFDNYVNPKLTSNYLFCVSGIGSAIEWTLGSNILYRGWGTGAPTNAYGAGSTYMRTDTATDGHFYVYTNSVGIPGWKKQLL